ncbi:unnamed protein product [Arctogadus glacialis]
MPSFGRAAKSYDLAGSIPTANREDIQKRRAEEYKKHQASIPFRVSQYAPWSPLLFQVSLQVTKGVLSLGSQSDAQSVEGGGKKFLVLEKLSLEELNKLLAKVTYTIPVYHIHTGDLVHFSFELHEAVFPIAIRQPTVPVLFDMGTKISDQVTVTTKTFMRYKELKVLIRSLRQFYKDVVLIVADDSFTPEKITEENVLQYIMPGGQGWFAGRTLAVSQVTTKYFL